MITGIYLAAFLAALFMTGTLIYRNKRIDTYFILFAIMVCVATLGQYCVATAKSLDTAILANKMIYVGSIFASWLMIVIVARICDLTIPKWLKETALAVSVAVILIMFTTESTHLYYKTQAIGKVGNATYLIKEYGPLHIAYPILMIIFSLLMLGYLIYAVRFRKEVSTRQVVVMSISVILIVVVYIVERMLKAKISYDAIGYCISAILLSYVFDHINKYDMTTNINHTMEIMNNYGYIIVDKKFRYINANETVKQLFPEILDEWRVDYVIPISTSYLYQEIICWAIEKKEKAMKIVHFYGKCFELKVSLLYSQVGRKIGHLIEFRDITEQHRYTDAMESFNARLQNEVAVKTENIQMVSDKLVLGMASMVESRDNSTGGHINRTSAVVNIFAKKLLNSSRGYHFTKDYLKQVTQAAPMHDLGKIAVDDAVLRKNGKFTDEEYAKMKEHSKEGARIVETILRGVKKDEFVDIARNVAFYHHEKWDGTGYPNKISGHDIPIEARIMALADVFDALVSKRCYKEAFSYDKAFTIIEESLGSHFDPELGKDFLACREELEAYYNSLDEE